MRTRTNKAFKSQNLEKKTDKTIDITECLTSFLRKWIFHLFYGDMSIENFGKIWCLDQC